MWVCLTVTHPCLKEYAEQTLSHFTDVETETRKAK